MAQQAVYPIATPRVTQTNIQRHVNQEDALSRSSAMPLKVFLVYRFLVNWAVRSVEAGHLLDLPHEFKDHTLNPWR